MEGYLIVGLYEDGRPGELFIKIAKEGSTLSGLFDTIGTLTSMGLQYGVPLSAISAKLQHTQFEPSGLTNNPDIPEATSLIDYMYRWLAMSLASRRQMQKNPDCRLICAGPKIVLCTCYESSAEPGDLAEEARRWVLIPIARIEKKGVSSWEQIRRRGQAL